MDGRFVNASILGLYETVTQGGWSATLLDAFGFDAALFSTICEPGTFLGTLVPEVAAGLGVRSGIPVAVGTHDMAAALVGSGSVEPGSILNNSASSEMVSIVTDRAVVSPRYYLRNAALAGTWQIYATTAGGFALDWFHEQFARDLTTDEFYDELVPRALDAFEQDGDVTFDPYLTGDRQSMEKKTGAWHGLTLEATREEMLAALLKSMNRTLGATIREAAGVVKLQAVIRVTGGMSSKAFLRLKEREIAGFSFEVVENCTAIGSVALAQRHL